MPKDKDEESIMMGFSLMSLFNAKDLDPAEGLDDKLLTVAEAAKMRNTTKMAIHSLIKRGRVKAVDIGGRKFIRLSELDAFEPMKPGPKLNDEGE